MISDPAYGCLFHVFLLVLAGGRRPVTDLREQAPPLPDPDALHPEFERRDPVNF